MQQELRTIARRVELQGAGLHSGEPVSLTLTPAPGEGLVFSRTDRKGLERVALSRDSFRNGDRCSVICGDNCSIATVEHLLAVFHVLGLTDIHTEVSGAELPSGDGSAAEFLALVDSAGIVGTGKLVRVFALQEPIAVGSPSGVIGAVPADSFSIAFRLDLSALGLGVQEVDYDITEESFRSEIARARTFVPAAMVPELLKQGFGKGATRENTLLLGDPESSPRFSHEAAAHKVLDILGDLACLSVPLKLRIGATGTGHAQNSELASKLHEALSAFRPEEEK